jgi:hypothetical protein
MLNGLLAAVCLAGIWAMGYALWQVISELP